MTLVAIIVITVGTVLCIVYIREMARNAIIGQQKREIFYEAVATIVDAPDDVVPNEIVAAFRVLTAHALSRLVVPGVLVMLIFHGFPNRNRDKHPNRLVEAEHRMPEPLQRLSTIAVRAWVEAMCRNNVIFGMIARRLLRIYTNHKPDDCADGVAEVVSTKIDRWIAESNDLSMLRAA